MGGAVLVSLKHILTSAHLFYDTEKYFKRCFHFKLCELVLFFRGIFHTYSLNIPHGFFGITVT